MSRDDYNYEPDSFNGFGFRGSKPTLPMIIILILIILQFGKKKFNGPTGGIDNGISFIIAIFYLSCCNICKQNSCC